MRNKITIIIPTRERCETLRHSIRTCLQQDYEPLEVIVSDNASQDGTRDVVRSFDDKRLKLVETGRRVGMSENFEFALSHVPDGYVMFIGDDDGIVANCLGYVNELIQKTGCRAVTCAQASYQWPNYPDASLANGISWNWRRGYEIRRSADYLADFLSGRPLYTHGLPGVYLGVAQRSLITEATRGPTFFRSRTPDAYSAIALAHHVDTFCFSHRPFAIAGASARSNGLSNLRGADGREAASFERESAIPFHPDLVDCASFRVIGIEAYFQYRSVFPERAMDSLFSWEVFLSAVLRELVERAGLLPAAKEAQVIDAVKTMCAVRGIDFGEVQRRGLKVARGRPSPAQARALPSLEYSGVSDGRRLGIQNVYDASLLLAFVEGIAAGQLNAPSSVLGRWGNSAKKRWSRLRSWLGQATR
jgi:glycosyltransferase involved in cell wall biosynthesis